jgi:phosphoribosylglycinamide formyltransferase-1
MLTMTRPLRVAVLCSGRAPGLLYLLNRDSRRGVAYEVVCCVTSEESFAEQPGVECRGVKVLTHPVARFCEARGVKRTNRGVRAEYDRETVTLLEPFQPDLVLLDGYLLMLTGPMLDAYHGRLINLHHSDLSVRNRDGSARFPGLRAVRDAVLDGEPDTRVSAHLVTAALDGGPVLLRSWAFPVPPVVEWAREHGASDILKSVIWAHQEWMLRDGFGPMLAAVVELAAFGLSHPGGRIDHVLLGRWLLARDGSFAPDGVMVEVV